MKNNDSLIEHPFYLARFLNFGTTNILDWTILCYGGWSVHRRMQQHPQPLCTRCQQQCSAPQHTQLFYLKISPDTAKCLLRSKIAPLRTSVLEGNSPALDSIEEQSVHSKQFRQSIVNNLDFADCTISDITTQLCHCSKKAATDTNKLMSVTVFQYNFIYKTNLAHRLSSAVPYKCRMSNSAVPFLDMHCCYCVTQPEPGLTYKQRGLCLHVSCEKGPCKALCLIGQV